MPRYRRCSTTFRAGARLRVEPLETRLLLAGETVLINFQLAGEPVPIRYAPDFGAEFGDRGNGLSYGWSSDHTDVARDRGLHPDQRLDTLVHFHEGQVWELMLANGTYEVTASIGDPQHESTHALNVEGTPLFAEVDLAPGQFLADSLEVSVTDGRLTLDQGGLPEKGTRINYIHVVGLPAGANAAPSTPTITRPAADAGPVSPMQVPMAAVGFIDPDGDSHLSSDWEIWTTGPSAERVWQTLGITGTGRLQPRLASGVFENSRAGRSEVLPDTQYVLRVRFRDAAGSVSDWAMQPFQTGNLSVPFVALEAGFTIDVVAEDFQLPVNIAFVPNPGPNPDDPLFYVTELYGTIKVVTNDYSASDYATGLLNFNPTGDFPGSGEQGLTGIVVEPETGDVIATRVTSEIPFDDQSPHHPQVIRFTSSDGGRTASGMTVLLDMVGESQGQSHQISNVSIGPDGMLYVHNGDGFNLATAQNLNSFRGKVLRMNLDGTAPLDNPFYDAADGTSARDYVFAYGLRNPFGGAWRASDAAHYEVENGPSVDRLARIDRGVNYGWDGSNASMAIHAIYNWNPAHAPANIVFVEPATFGGSGFPPGWTDRALVSESAPTYSNGPQVRGKRIVSFEIDAAGDLVSGPTTFVEYVGTGRATVLGLAAGPDGIYFTDLYKDENALTPIDRGARVYRVRYTGRPGDYDGNGDVDQADLDLVLLGWGQAAANAPENWTHSLPGGRIDQDELDAVLLNWGAMSPSQVLPRASATPSGPQKAADAPKKPAARAAALASFAQLPLRDLGDARLGKGGQEPAD